ncbi:hypothetical protein BKH43_01470 [Helicobacter sp. 13S00401-1]|uniref:restriction endonuclease subunit S n=1 Tax=Helicobacter sp. 13S00401-1 TaxID=1905758 RepID=UPI000BA54523|nr:restriction endonuclease subunit S [Helicobacter sp. 13S00401-1]PAF51335.1 hypothetical protein BKH43_01470 [Helicobacter sp. 13S00401-1]
MITKDKFKALLKSLNFTNEQDVYAKTFKDYALKVDFKNEKLIYPEGLIINEKQTCNFSQNENFVVFECVHRLLEKGYRPRDLELEPKWQLGHSQKSGRADIWVRIKKEDFIESLLIIECKTEGKEFNDAWKDTLDDGAQLFSYLQQERDTKFLCLYASDFTTVLQVDYKLIKVQDNEAFIKTLKEPKTYTKAKNNKELFNVWKETYDRSFATRGLFEKEIEAYHIGKNKYTLSDLQEVKSETEIQAKYHEFATILRKYNVSGHENAFDKLVNLFLAKVVDETEYSDEKGLQFYWKGVAYDNDFDLQDRLQLLYKIGMEKFLNEEVTYIDNKTIEDAFTLFKNKPDETKRTVLNYFRQLKFYTNNDFAFIDVHNERLFKQNARVLKEIVEMFQDIKLKTTEQHQFLGDLFEGFLDQGIKQSEGQFFTPMPIVKFLISALPLQKIIKSSEIPKVIDYACGAGHFLNEYAHQIKSIIPENTLIEHYKNITGIEKEYRLSKVAKVSAFMYGQDDINIIYEDALAGTILSEKHHIKNHTFSVLVANPPYSVKGFLNTLKEDDQNLFSLTKEVGDKEKNNAIETFFIERAHQLLQEGGVAAIILPSSILSNGNIYIKVREIILKYFDLIAIAEFGSGTFGKTGTNTATLFLRRKAQNPDLAAHYKNRVDAWFSGDFNADKVFEDSHLLQAYCAHIGVEVEAYKTLLHGNLKESLQSKDILKAYRKTFEDDSKARAIKKKRLSAKYTQVDKNTELEKYITQAICNAEKEKLYFFMLAKSNPQEVIIVKSPTENKEMKQFLGYEWSGAKGNEGIKYIGAYKTDDDELMSSKSIRQIKTPLFNPNDLDDTSKINTLIRQNFVGGGGIFISENLSTYVSMVSLVDILDFSRVEFDKAFKTSGIKKVEIESKYPLVKLGEIAEVSAGNSAPQDSQMFENGKYPFFRVSDVAKEHISNNLISTKSYLNDKGILKMKLFKKGTILFPKSGASTYLDHRAVMGIDGYVSSHLSTIFINTKIVLIKYVYENLVLVKAREIKPNSGYPSLNEMDIKNIKIPLPPLDIQKQIVEECEKVDEDYNTSRMSIEEYKKKIAKVFEDLEALVKARKVTLYKLGEVCELLKRGKATKYGNSNIQVIKSGQARGYLEFDFKERYYATREFKADERKLIKGDILINSTGVGTAGRVTLFDLDGDFVVDSHITIFRTNKSVIPKFALYALADIGFDKIEKMANGASGQIELSLSTILNIQIPVPPLAKQKEIVQEIESYEAEINKARQVMAGCASRKEAILKKYLN